MQSFFSVTWTILCVPVLLLSIVGLFVVVLLSYHTVIAYRSGRRLKKGEHNRVKKPRLFRSLLLASSQFVDDYFSRSPEYFKYQGVIVFCGRQGSGKTVALVEQTQRWQAEYPKVKVIGNVAFSGQDDELNDWRQLTDYGNGIQGVVAQIDEMQNWFSSNQSKNFPPEMLEVVTQNRKNRRVILGTSQVFCRLSKPLREQVTEVRNCFTVWGCFTFVHRVTPEIDSEGIVLKYKHLGWYYFPHTQKIRDSYDTYRVIRSLSKSGFSPVVNGIKT